jgi:hypothetical protein
MIFMIILIVRIYIHYIFEFVIYIYICDFYFLLCVPTILILIQQYNTNNTKDIKDEAKSSTSARSNIAADFIEGGSAYASASRNKYIKKVKKTTSTSENLEVKKETTIKPQYIQDNNTHTNYCTIVVFILIVTFIVGGIFRNIRDDEVQ